MCVCLYVYMCICSYVRNVCDVCVCVCVKCVCVCVQNKLALGMCVFVQAP